MIRLSCSSVCLRHLPLRDMLRTYAEIGFHRLELAALGSWSIDLDDWDAPGLRAVLEEHGQELIALYTRPIDAHCDEGFAKSLDHIRRGIDVAAELGCRRIVFSPLLPRDDYDYELLAEGCRALAEHVGDRDVIVALENHHEWPLSYPEDYERLFSLVPDARIAIAMDTGHFTSSRVDMLAFVDRFAERIRHLHLKDHRGTHCVPFGEGETDNVAVVRRLGEIGYDGYASVELEIGDKENTERCLAEAFDYCRDVLGLT